MLRKEHEKLEEISRQFLWAIEMIPEARELNLGKRLTLVEIESSCAEATDRGVFNILLDDEVWFSSKKFYTDYSAHSVMALLEILNSLLKGKKEFKLFKAEVDGDVAYEIETQTQYNRHDGWNIVFVDKYEPVEDYDFQQAILKASGYKLGLCHYELSGGIFSSVYVDCGIIEVEDVEGDFYAIHEREEVTEEDYAKANEVLDAWIAKGFEI